MLQKPAHNASDPDGFALPLHSRPQTANASNQQVDGNACARCGIEFFDQYRIGDRIHLRDDRGRTAGSMVFDLTPDEFDEAGAEIDRSDSEVSG
jgi:hypothetical protein